MNNINIKSILKLLKDEEHLYGGLLDKIVSFIKRDPSIKHLVHSYKSRLKSEDRIIEKIHRKNQVAPDDPITVANVKKRITDIVGLRILHLHLGQVHEMHEAIMNYVRSGEIVLYENPKAYTWDPEYSQHFKLIGLDSTQKESFYTSIHYVVKPREDSDIACEIQVRTLFEEVWGEIDHTLNYPRKSSNFAVQEQLKVLARIVGAGTRLADSIFKISDNA